MLEDLFAAFARVVRGTLGDDLTVPLAAAVREVATIAGADRVVLRLPVGPSRHLDVRIPQGDPWPSAGLMRRWHAEVAELKCPIEVAARDRPGRLSSRSGVILPVFTADGAVGALGVFPTSRAPSAPEQWAGLVLLVQLAVARIETERLRRHTEAVTTTVVHDRVAREIHDGPLQVLSGVMLHLRLIRSRAGKRTSESLLRLEAETQQAIKQMRALIRNLRIAQSEAALEERVRDALARLERTQGLTWALKWREPDGMIRNVAADEVFQVINEALANVYRHSSAKHVEVRGHVREGMFEVTVRDDGVGFDVAQALRTNVHKLSFGLTTMQERVAKLGGTLTLRSQPGRGTRVLISVPVFRPDAGGDA